VSLKDARKRRDEARKQVADGIDPGAAKVGGKNQRSAGMQQAGAKPEPASSPAQAGTKGNQAKPERGTEPVAEFSEHPAAMNPGPA